MENKFKKVPAIEKCFKILEALAKSEEPLGISDISKKLGINKSTVYNIIYTLAALHVLNCLPSGRFSLGTLFYTLANMASRKSNLIQLAHPYLEFIKNESGLSVFLGVRSGAQAILVDKVEADHGIKLSSDIGLTMPPFAGAGIKAMLSQLSEDKIEELLEKTELRKYTEKTIIDKDKFKSELLRIKKEGIAYDFEEYIEGMIGLSVPIETGSKNVQSAIWVVGLKSQLPNEKIDEIVKMLLSVAKEINAVNTQKV
ncbi:MAG: IclR family transcriptional regulator [Deltaproteobacteria bacterium]|nr:IclR family transcriptional regulator [Deltaproteobacteria bacterium]